MDQVTHEGKYFIFPNITSWEYCWSEGDDLLRGHLLCQRMFGERTHFRADVVNPRGDIGQWFLAFIPETASNNGLVVVPVTGKAREGDVEDVMSFVDAVLVDVGNKGIHGQDSITKVAIGHQDSDSESKGGW